ncbi:hypothetical protein HPS54_11370 [Prevotella sp. PCHR]|uniref:Uncharacterized protein n=1 Tax=Xylanibacter caecicola TaxID=2736294 RepID=A0ABX2B3K8_9BACT|nr:hypothetical protein [Xylanibacter caecicola]NPE26099.1 hypothetical protein [Xylanibacter caecicola]
MIYFTFAGRLNNKNQVGLRTKIKKLLYLLFKPIIANPDFEDKFDYVSKWYIEYNDREGYVNREIGIDNKGNTIVKAPYKKNVGLWCDEDLPYEQYKEMGITEITAEIFNEKWSELSI